MGAERRVRVRNQVSFELWLKPEAVELETLAESGGRGTESS